MLRERREERRTLGHGKKMELVVQPDSLRSRSLRVLGRRKKNGLKRTNSFIFRPHDSQG